MNDSVINSQATQHFSDARSQARQRQWLARITGQERNLLPFEEIRAQLRQQNPLYQGVFQIPLDRIAGSVGRYHDFDRHFLPLKDSLEKRWVNIEALAHTKGWPPIETYQIGGVYFVRDGNHRVAVARQMDLSTIEAHVWEFPDEIHIRPEDTLDEVLIRFGEQHFLAETNLDKLRPEHHIQFTSPGRYPELQAQIAAMRDMLTHIDGDVPSEEEQVMAWYDLVYLPTVQIIREGDLLVTFPGRTEADLFVWLSYHRQEMIRRYGTHEHLSELTTSLARQYGEHAVNRIWRQLKQSLGHPTHAPLRSPPLMVNGE